MSAEAAFANTLTSGLKKPYKWKKVKLNSHRKELRTFGKPRRPGPNLDCAKRSCGESKTLGMTIHPKFKVMVLFLSILNHMKRSLLKDIPVPVKQPPLSLVLYRGLTSVSQSLRCWSLPIPVS